MGIVHLARRDDGARVALKVLRPHIVGDEEARRRLEREVGSLRRIRSRWVAEIVDADPWAADPVRRHPLRAGAVAARPRARGGADRGRRPALVRRLPGRGADVGARRRRAAPRREAVQRADGGPHPDPHRLRPGPGGRRPPAHPHRLAARHARLPRPRDPLRRRRHVRLRRALLGGHRRVRRHRPLAVRPRPGDGDHGPGPPRRARPHRAARVRCATSSRARSTPSPTTGPRSTPSSPGCGRRPPGPARCCRRRATADDDPFTVPLAVAGPPAPEDDTRPETGATAHPGAAAADSHAAPAGRPADRLPRPARPRCAEHPLPPRPTARGGAVAPGPPSTPPPTPLGERLRRAALVVAGCLLVGAACAAAPWAAAAVSCSVATGCCGPGRWRPAPRATGAGCAAASGTTASRCSSARRGTCCRASPRTLMLVLWAAGLATSAAAHLLRGGRHRRRHAGGERGRARLLAVDRTRRQPAALAARPRGQPALAAVSAPGCWCSSCRWSWPRCSPSLAQTNGVDVDARRPTVPSDRFSRPGAETSSARGPIPAAPISR